LQLPGGFAADPAGLSGESTVQPHETLSLA